MNGHPVEQTTPSAPLRRLRAVCLCRGHPSLAKEGSHTTQPLTTITHHSPLTTLTTPTTTPTLPTTLTTTLTAPTTLTALTTLTARSTPSKKWFRSKRRL